MQTPTTIWRAALVTATLGFAVTSCTTDGPAGTTKSGAPSAQLIEHQRKQKIRFQQGNYKRLYRPKTCVGRPGCRV